MYTLFYSDHTPMFSHHDLTENHWSWKDESTVLSTSADVSWYIKLLIAQGQSLVVFL